MLRQNIVIIDAPSNLGLRPPREGSIPGCYKMPWALRNANLIQLLGARDGGCVIPPRYKADWQLGDHTRNSESLLLYSKTLALRLTEIINDSCFPVVIGGDCSIVLAAGLALKERGRYGLVFLDAHSDFRHLGNSGKIDAAAGEDLAISLGLGDPRLINLSGSGPNFRADDVAVLGIRHFDEHLEELDSRGVWYATSNQLSVGQAQCIERATSIVSEQTDGFWVHVDFDVVDLSEMMASDCPESDGISFETLSQLLSSFVQHRKCVGVELTIYDPDLDPSGVCSDRIVQCLYSAF